MSKLIKNKLELDCIINRIIGEYLFYYTDYKCSSTKNGGSLR